jgi:hypothetical protein
MTHEFVKSGPTDPISRCLNTDIDPRGQDVLVVNYHHHTHQESFDLNERKIFEQKESGIK